MNCSEYLNLDKVQRWLLIGTVLMLLATLAVMTIMLQSQFNSRLLQIENATITNNQRLNNIAGFLNQVASQQQVSQNSMQSMMSALSKEAPEQK